MVWLTLCVRLFAVCLELLHIWDFKPGLLHWKGWNSCNDSDDAEEKGQLSGVTKAGVYLSEA